jgi:NDP-sugar pyrophosphorylase family protein
VSAGGPDAVRPLAWPGPEPDLGLPALVLAGGSPARFADGADAPFLELQLEWLVFQGVRRVVFCLGSEAERIRNHLGDGSAWGVRVAYSVEEGPLGTAGALALAAPIAAGPFLALHGDSFVDVDLAALVRFHRALRRRDPRCAGTVVLGFAADGRAASAPALDACGRVIRFGAPTHERSLWLASAGLYVLEPALLAGVAAGRPVSLEREVLPRAEARGLHLYGFVTRRSSVDVGPGSERLELLFGRQQERQDSP